MNLKKSNLPLLSTEAREYQQLPSTELTERTGIPTVIARTSVQAVPYGYPVNATPVSLPAPASPSAPRPAIISRPYIFQPNIVSGICCPVGTIYNHEQLKLAPDDKLKFNWKLLTIIDVGFQLFQLLKMALVCAEIRGNLAAYLTLLMTQIDPYEDLDVVTAIEDQASTSPTAIAQFYFITDFIFLIYFVFTRVIFFAFYKPNTAAVLKEDNEVVVMKPTLFGRIFFPLATVYYHEGNEYNCSVCCACCFRFLYGLIYTPSYNSRSRVIVLNQQV